MPFEIDIGDIDEGRRITIRVDPTEKIVESISGIISYWDIEGDITIYKEGKEINVNQKWADSIIEDGDFVSIKSKIYDRTLPNDLWLSRVENELDHLLEEDVNVIQKNNMDTYMEIKLRLNNTPGPINIGSNIALSFDHIIQLKIPRSYPYSSPIIKWKDDIFHPNIQSPKNGGFVKMTYLENWSFSSDLKSLVNEIKKLLVKPEIDKSWETRECNEALEYYLSSGFPEPKK
ncbi:MAG: ubiquitin-conjugating enzyme E2 [Candidatus Saliniplasma sp.]